MSFDADEEILQDFLLEAGEILEQLSEQLVELENQPDDVDLLNAIFRGFHTVKGGAGFLQLDALVDLCHVAENAFDLLRNGKLKVTSELMDVVLRALDSCNDMFAEVHNRKTPSPADPSIFEAINQLVTGEAPAPAPAPTPTAEAPEIPPETPPASNDDASASDDDISDAEFAQLVDVIQSDDAPADVSSPPSQPDTAEATSSSESDDDDLFNIQQDNSSDSSNEITEAEFDALLEQLHGKSAPSADVDAKASTEETQTPEVTESAKESPDVLSAGAQTDEISETEFDALLDELHGKGKKISGDNPAASPVAVEDSKQGEGGSVASSENELIGDNEFDALLDELHGAGKAPGKPGSSSVSSNNSSGESSGVSKEQASPVANTAATGAAKTSAPKKVPAKPAASAKSSAPAPAPAPKQAGAAKRPSRDAPVAAETTVRVDTKRLDDIMNMVGELVLVRNRLVRLGLKSNDEAMSRAVANLDVVTADLQMSVMKTRMQPIKKVFGRFPRVVRDLARNLKKEINLELQGEETDLDKNLVEALADPLVHLVRNSVDHGVEMPDVRESMGKSRSGKITLAAQQEGDHIVLSITDDGGGMDASVLKQKAVEKGLMDEEAAERLSETEAFNLIFHPGFSTKEQVSDVSGRGVGMDVVKTKISQLNGTIDVQSAQGEGTQIAIKVPLTLAIMPTLMVMLGYQTFALPLVSVNEIFHMDLSQTNIVDGQEVVIVREKALPLFHLKKWLITEDAGEAVKESAHVVIVSVATQKVGFVVDALIGQEEVVIKPLGKMLHGTPGMAGATITGDGRIALILDVPSMLRRYANHT